MNEKTFNAYAIPSNTPWITSKPLKRTPEGEQHRKMREFFATHDLHETVDSNGKITVYATPKKGL